MVAAHELGLADRLRTVRTVVRMGKPNDALLPDNPLSKIPTLVLDDGTRALRQPDDHRVPRRAGGRRAARAGGRGAVGGADAPRARQRAARPPHPLAQRARQAGGAAHAGMAGRASPRRPRRRSTTSSATRRASRKAPSASARSPSAAPLSYLDFRFPDLAWRDGRPALAAWHERFAARPSVRATEAVDD